MKNLMIILMLAFFVAGTTQTQAQAANKIETIEIKTSAQCGMCKDRIEKAMAFEKGVVSAELNVDSKVLTVKYKTKKTVPEKIKLAISKVGYDADDVAADPKAYEKLHYCCKKP